MIETLKRGKSDVERADDDAKVQTVVKDTLAAIESRGDAAVRELAITFDKDDRASYRLSESEIERLVAKVKPRDLDDIRFAQTQVRQFAEAQRNSMTDIEVEPMPR